ncbi:Choline dehydrogenase, mitochondrial [Trachymyrmex septentrionalis]|uniref:Choline dehydrogenase, mitochondrial n=1 Tax=Trachymyrmex septentrionalis TaxID=34720 RepID=A0A151JYH4_9HYME|nr:Choline dehydrogenase, mitochondrial [Trachymyrmex septentrionalis]
MPGELLSAIFYYRASRRPIANSQFKYAGLLHLLTAIAIIIPLQSSGQSTMKRFLRRKELGYPLLDYNGKNIIGFSYVQATTINRIRMSSNRVYLHLARNRQNFHAARESRMKKVLIDRHTNRAIGVKFIKHRRIINVFASKEVILCAGAIGSSQLLMLSGIRLAKHLSELGINVIRDLPVDENLECEILAFIDIKYSVKLHGLPDIELLFVNTYRWIVLLILLRSKSRGRIRLLANDINVKIEIVSNYFDNPEDVKTMISLTICHYTGTCKIRPKGDPTAVVDYLD